MFFISPPDEKKFATLAMRCLSKGVRALQVVHFPAISLQVVPCSGAVGCFLCIVAPSAVADFWLHWRFGTFDWVLTAFALLF
jgi:hypothetical protein